MTRTPRRLVGRVVTLGLAAAALMGAAYVGAPALRAADWPALRGDDRRSGVSTENLAPPLSLLWRYTGGRLGNNSASPVVAGDTVYFVGRAKNEQGAGGAVMALDPKTGARRWVFPNENGLTNRALFTTSPTVAGGHVYVGASDGNLYMVDAKTGREVRRFRTGAPLLVAPLVVESNGQEVLYFGSNDRRVYALNPEDGTSFWTTGKNQAYLYPAGDNVTSAPIYADNYLYFTTADQRVHAVNASTGKPKYALRLPFRFPPNAPLYADNTLYIPSGPRLHAVQPTSGSMRWSRDLPGDILVPPVSVEGVIYAACRNSRTQNYELYALRSNGREFWKAPVVLPFAPSAAPIVSGDVMYVPTNRNVLLALSREDGKVMWQYRVDPSSSAANVTPSNDVALNAPVAISNGTLYALGDDGTLSAFRKDAPDQTGPLLSVVYPKPGQAVNGGPGLVLAAKVIDPGSGLDDAAFKMTLDGRDLEPQFDLSRNLVYFQTKGTGKIVETATIPDGRHTVEVIAKDYKGNEQKETWSFVVNNSLPKPATSIAPAPRPGGIGAPGRGTGGGAGRPGRGGGAPAPAPAPGAPGAPPPPPGG